MPFVTTTSTSLVVIYATAFLGATAAAAGYLSFGFSAWLIWAGLGIMAAIQQTGIALCDQLSSAENPEDFHIKVTSIKLLSEAMVGGPMAVGGGLFLIAGYEHFGSKVPSFAMTCAFAYFCGLAGKQAPAIIATILKNQIKNLKS